ncbi:MAG TPA: PQQ-dependent sugar dehydrogenase [Verrucomicrobiae bacterium]|nr:PQQ-dependent sugar dehydrogenase [Verrucomicrobiae bacterium]
MNTVPFRCLVVLGLFLDSITIGQGQSYGLDSRAPIGPLLNSALPGIPPGLVSGGGWSTVPAFPNLTFANPVALVAEPRTRRLFVCGREGLIHFFENDPATATKTLFLDIRARTQGYDDCGLLGMAFHPEFNLPGSTNRHYFYVYYNYSPSPSIPGGNHRPPVTTKSYNRLSRFTVPEGSAVADPGSELVLINQFDVNLWHNGGGMFFGADGFLYLSNGDGGGDNDPNDNTQRIDFGLFSGVLRLDVDQNPARSHPIRRQPQSRGVVPSGWPASYTSNYFIPNDNPWVNVDGSVLEEFWAIGLRSPHRMTFDPVSGQIWNGDVGQDMREEVNLIVRGGNYQWAYMEGTMAGPKARPSSILGTDRPPVYDYPHADANACVIGGYIYRGLQHAADLSGKYIFGDNFSGRLWALNYRPNGGSTVEYLCSMPPGKNYLGLSSFGLDQDNELYMCQMGPTGQIWKLARGGTPSPQPPALLSQTAAFADLASLAPRSGLVPYDVNSALWSDNAVKQRWIALPNDGAPYSTNEQVGFAPTGEWSFPAGTVFMKHFELLTNETNADLTRRLETRFLVRATNGMFYGVTYKWRADNSDADLLTNSLSENILITTATGTLTQTWYYPSPQECLSCHTSAAGWVLGVKTRQLNRDFIYPATARSDNQLRTWNHLGMFAPAIDESSITNYDRLVKVNDTSAVLAERMRSYLDANCAHCHRPLGVRANFDARFDIPLAEQNIVSGPVNNDLGIPDARAVAPGSLSRSIMYLRLTTNGAIQMPPLARNLVDSNAVSALTNWIHSLATPPSIVWIATSNQSVKIGWSAMPGATYRVQDRTNLSHAEWSNVSGDVTASGPLATKIDSRGIDSQLFYRILLVP